MDIPFSAASLAQIQNLSSLLHLFHHRNANQHRHSIWYRHFSLFRKQLRQLVQDLQTLHNNNSSDSNLPNSSNPALTGPTPKKTHLALSLQKSHSAKLLSRTTTRLDFWRDVLLPKWQHAFSQLVADGRFAVLGLVLLAVLAEVCERVGITAEVEEMGHGEVERILEEFGREEWGLRGAGGDGRRMGRGGGGGDGGEDLGEAVERGEEGVEVEEGEGGITSTVTAVKGAERTEMSTTMPQTLTTSMKRAAGTVEKSARKKKRRKGDAIDDIFG